MTFISSNKNHLLFNIENRNQLLRLPYGNQFTYLLDDQATSKKKSTAYKRYSSKFVLQNVSKFVLQKLTLQRELNGNNTQKKTEKSIIGKKLDEGIKISRIERLAKNAICSANLNAPLPQNVLLFAPKNWSLYSSKAFILKHKKEVPSLVAIDSKLTFLISENINNLKEKLYFIKKFAPKLRVWGFAFGSSFFLISITRILQRQEQKGWFFIFSRNMFPGLHVTSEESSWESFENITLKYLSRKCLPDCTQNSKNLVKKIDCYKDILYLSLCESWNQQVIENYTTVFSKHYDPILSESALFSHFEKENQIKKKVKKEDEKSSYNYRSKICKNTSTCNEWIAKPFYLMHARFPPKKEISKDVNNSNQNDFTCTERNKPRQSSVSFDINNVFKPKINRYKERMYFENDSIPSKMSSSTTPYSKQDSLQVPFVQKLSRDKSVTYPFIKKKISDDAGVKNRVLKEKVFINKKDDFLSLNDTKLPNSIEKVKAINYIESPYDLIKKLFYDSDNFCVDLKAFYEKKKKKDTENTEDRYTENTKNKYIEDLKEEDTEDRYTKDTEDKAFSDEDFQYEKPCKRSLRSQHLEQPLDGVNKNFKHDYSGKEPAEKLSTSKPNLLEDSADDEEQKFLEEIDFLREETSKDYQSELEKPPNASLEKEVFEKIINRDRFSFLQKKKFFKLPPPSFRDRSSQKVTPFFSKVSSNFLQGIDLPVGHGSYSIYDKSSQIEIDFEPKNNLSESRSFSHGSENGDKKPRNSYTHSKESRFKKSEKLLSSLLFKRKILSNRRMSGYQQPETKRLRIKGGKDRSICRGNRRTEFSIKIPPALPFYESKLNALKYSFNRTFTEALGEFLQKKVGQVNQSQTSSNSSKPAFSITRLKKMPYKELSLNEKGEVESLFEQVNKTFYLSPYRFAFNKSLFADYNDYLNWPKDNSIESAINRFIEKEKKVVKESEDSSSDQIDKYTMTAEEPDEVDLGNSEALVSNRKFDIENRDIIPSENIKSDELGNRVNTKVLHETIERFKDDITLYEESLEEEMLNRPGSHSMISVKSSPKKKREKTSPKVEWLTKLFDSEQALQKRKNLEKFAWSKKKALANSCLPKSSGKIHSLLVSDRKSSFFGITNPFPKRLVSEDEKEVTSQILRDDLNPKSVSFLESLHLKSDKKNSFSPKEVGLFENKLGVNSEEQIENQSQKDINAQANRSASNISYRKKAELCKTICTCKPLSFKKTKEKSITRLYPVYTPNRRLRLRAPQASQALENNDNKSPIGNLLKTMKDRWSRKRRLASSLLGAPSRRYLVMPEISTQHWRKIIEWQLKIYFLEQEKKVLKEQKETLENFFLSKPNFSFSISKENRDKNRENLYIQNEDLLAKLSHSIKLSFDEQDNNLSFENKTREKEIRLRQNSEKKSFVTQAPDKKQLFQVHKLSIDVPLTCLKKSLKKPFEWPVTLLSYSSSLQPQTPRLSNRSNRFFSQRENSSSSANNFLTPKVWFCSEKSVSSKKFNPSFCKLLRQGIEKGKLSEVPQKSRASLSQNFFGSSATKARVELGNNPVQNFVKNKKTYSCFVSSISPPFKSAPFKLHNRKSDRLALSHFFPGTALKGLDQSHVSKPFLFEAVTQDSYLFLQVLYLSYIIKIFFGGLSKILGTAIVSKIKNSSLSVLLFSLFFKAFGSSNRIYSFDSLKTRAKHLAGSEDTISSLSEIVWYLRNSCRGRLIPRGVILLENFSSESTNFLKAIGGEAQVPVIVQSLRALPYTENHPQRHLDKILTFAQKRAPCILFLDDLDSIGQSRRSLLKNNRESFKSEISLDRFKSWRQKTGQSRKDRVINCLPLSKSFITNISQITPLKRPSLESAYIPLSSSHKYKSSYVPLSNTFGISNLEFGLQNEILYAKKEPKRSQKGAKSPSVLPSSYKYKLLQIEDLPKSYTRIYAHGTPLVKNGGEALFTKLSICKSGGEKRKWKTMASTNPKFVRRFATRKNLEKPINLVTKTVESSHSIAVSSCKASLKSSYTDKAFLAKSKKDFGTSLTKQNQHTYAHVPTIEDVYAKVSTDSEKSSYKSQICKPKYDNTLKNFSELGKAKTTPFTSSPETEKEVEQRRINLMLRLLTVMDGISALNGVLIVTTSKNPSRLDPALLRPGRFEKLIHLKLPTKKKRIQLLKRESARLGYTNPMPWEYLGSQTQNMTGSQISSAVNHSAFRAIIQSTVHTFPTLEYGINRVTLPSKAPTYKTNCTKRTFVANTNCCKHKSSSNYKYKSSICKKICSCNKICQRFALEHNLEMLPITGSSFSDNKKERNEENGVSSQISFYKAGKEIVQALFLKDSFYKICSNTEKASQRKDLASLKAKERLLRKKNGFGPIKGVTSRRERIRARKTFLSPSRLQIENLYPHGQACKATRVKSFAPMQSIDRSPNRYLIRTDFAKETINLYAGQAALALYLDSIGSFKNRGFSETFLGHQKRLLALHSTFSYNEGFHAFSLIKDIMAHLRFYPKTKQDIFNIIENSKFIPRFTDKEFVCANQSFLRNKKFSEDIDYLNYNMVLTCFYVAFQNCTENRELLDFVTDHLIRFKVLKLHELLRIVSFY